MKLVFCACGKLVRFPGETRCEDCWADDQKDYHGYSQAEKLFTSRVRETSQHEEVPKMSRRKA